MTKSQQQIVLLYTCTIFGLVSGVLVSILNTHALPPAEYGDVRYVNNIISLLSGVFLFGYFISGSRMLALAPTKEKAREIKGTMISVLFLTYLLLTLCMLLCGLFHYVVLGKPYYSLFFYVMPVCGNVLLLNYVNTSSQGDNSIGLIASARLLPSLLYLVTGYFVYSHYGATSSLMLLLHDGIAMAVLAVLILMNKPSFKNVKSTFKELHDYNKEFGFKVYLGSLVNVSVHYIAAFTLGLFAVNNTNVGFYSLALTISAPLAMLPNVIGTTYFKQFAHQSIIPYKVKMGTFFISILSLVGYIILIYPLVDFIYPETYHVVAIYASILAVGGTLQGVGDVFNRFLLAHGQGDQIRNVAFISGSFAFVGYTVGVYFFGINAAIVTHVGSSVIYFALMLFYYNKYVVING